MNLIATLILAPILGWIIGSRKILFSALTAVWAIGLPPTAHFVLRHDNPKGSLADTLSFFAVSYIGLALSLGLAQLVYRRRNRGHAAVTATV